MTNDDVAKPVRVGLVGLGGVCEQVHYPGFSRIPGVVIAALVDSDSNLLSQRKKQWLLAEGTYPDLATALQEADLDAVAIATPNNLHQGLIEKALSSGCHVLCEKPLGIDFEQTLSIYEKAQTSGLRHMTAFTYRFVPGMTYLKHLIDSGQLGQIRHARFQRLQDWGEFSIGWRQYKDQAGLGELGDMGIHRIDYAENLMGPIRSVCGLTKQLVERDKRPDGTSCPPQDVEDWVAWIAEFESGATAVFEMGKLTKGHGPQGDHDLAELNGTKASGSYRLHTPYEIEFGGRQEPYQTVPVPDRFLTRPGSPRKPYDGELTTIFRYDQAWEFISAIREGRECIPSFYHGMRAQLVADMVVKASNERRWVDIPIISSFQGQT
tara:strand:+ start:697 stop:1833 length:1137 start_codon:yes stop_codon:yes gene_type:complete